MLSNWKYVDIHHFLHGSQIYSIVFFALSIFVFLINCAQRGGGGGATGNTGPGSRVKTQTSQTTHTTGQAETTAIAQDSLMAKPESPNETKSKKGKNEMLDSIKVIKGKKNFRKATQKQKKEETDSQHTQIINIPLGKASESSNGVSKLTAADEQKVVEKPNGKKIQFAEKIVKSTVTPGGAKK
ncbi:unnamed protein product [Caenorhabditis brenneri]